MIIRNGKPDSSTEQSSGDGISLDALTEAMKAALGPALAEEVKRAIGNSLTERQDGTYSQEDMSEETMQHIAAAMAKAGNGDIESNVDRLGEETEVSGNRDSNRDIIDGFKDL